jgi:hypothetical protein
VHHNAANADTARRAYYSLRGISKESASQAAALEFSIDRQSG